MICQISGGTSSLELYDDYLVIKPSGAQKLNGHEQTIPLDSVVTISIVKPFLKVPFMQVITPNLHQTKKDQLKGASANVVLIQPGNMKTAERIRDYIADYKAGRIQRSSTVPAQGAPAGSLDDLKTLAELRDSGIITEQEFEAKKKQILGL